MHDLPHLDAVLAEHATALGRDLAPYRHHCLRVAHLALALVGDRGDDGEAREKIALAAAFHDIGIWTDGTFDYLEPSVRVARAYLDRIGRAGWSGEIAAMIREHHRIRASRERADWLVEPFRKADWIDVTRGLLAHGVPRRVRADVFARWPALGFRWRLVQLTLRRLRTHPLSPLPMLRF